MFYGGGAIDWLFTPVLVEQVHDGPSGPIQNDKAIR